MSFFGARVITFKGQPLNAGTVLPKLFLFAPREVSERSSAMHDPVVLTEPNARKGARRKRSGLLDRLNPPQATRLQPVVRRGGNPACGVAPGGLQPVPLSHRSGISKRVMIIANDP